MSYFLFFIFSDGLWTLLCRSEGDPILPQALIDSGLTFVPEDDEKSSSYLISRKSSDGLGGDKRNDDF
jgi:hypothetical protein